MNYSVVYGKESANIILASCFLENFTLLPFDSLIVEIYITEIYTAYKYLLYLLLTLDKSCVKFKIFLDY